LADLHPELADLDLLEETAQAYIPASDNDPGGRHHHRPHSYTPRSERPRTRPSSISGGHSDSYPSSRRSKRRRRRRRSVPAPVPVPATMAPTKYVPSATGLTEPCEGNWGFDPNCEVLDYTIANDPPYYLDKRPENVKYRKQSWKD